MKTKEQNLFTSTVKMLWRMLGYMRPWAVVFAIGTFIWAIQDSMGIIPAFYMRSVFSAILDHNMSGVYQASIIYLCLHTAWFAIFCFSGYFWMDVHSKCRVSFYQSVFHKLLRTETKQHTGASISLLSDDAKQAINGMIYSANHYFMAGFALLVSAGVVLTVDWRLAVISVVLGILFMIIDLLFAKPIRRVGEAVQQETSLGNERLLDVIAGALTIRLFSLASVKTEQYVQVLRRIRLQGLRLVRMNALKTFIDEWKNWMISSGILGLGCIFVAQGNITLPDLMMASVMLGQLVWKFQLISWTSSWVQRNMAAAERVFRMMDSPVEDMRTAQPELLPQGDIALDMNHVSFSYADQRELVLDDLSLHVKKGEFVALVGTSGSGKSTIFNMLLGMITPQQGEVRAWGERCTSTSLASWRKQFAYVAQESPLFDASIAENIGMGDALATEADIERAAHNAYAYEFLADMPQGIQSQTGEMGVKISGGQRQRIVIARALLRNAPVLLLDEATSSLDAESEVEVQRAIDRLVEGRTVLVAAHRLSTIRHADRIVVLEHGRIVEEGTHQSLLAREGSYAGMWNAQL